MTNKGSTIYYQCRDHLFQALPEFVPICSQGQEVAYRLDNDVRRYVRGPEAAVERAVREALVLGYRKGQ